jgi:hypothetical protein
MLPTVFLLGAQKCGTTSLNADLHKAFPELLAAERVLPRKGWTTKKELHMFDDRKMVALGLARYAACFPSCTDTPRVFAMDSTPNYLMAPSASEDMWRMYPARLRSQMRFLVVLRDPTVRFKSFFGHFVAGTEPGLDVNRFAHRTISTTLECAQRERVDANNSVALHASKCRIGNPLCGGLYAAQLARWLAYYESSQFAIVSFRAYVTQTDAVFRQIGSFLGLEARTAATLGARERTEGDAPQAVPSIRAHGREAMKASWINSQPQHALDPDARQALDMFYEPSIRDLGALLREHTNKGMAVLPRGVYDAVLAATSPLETAREVLSVQ